MRRTCICRGNEQQSLLLSRVSCSCSSHAEDEYAASRAAKAGSCLVPALVSLSVQIFPTESFIVHTADLSAFAGCFGIRLNLLNLIIGLESASTGHWPINRRCANKLCAYGVLPILVVKTQNRGPTRDEPAKLLRLLSFDSHEVRYSLLPCSNIGRLRVLP